MAYDGRILRRAVQKFEEDRRAREQQFQTRREAIFRRQPRLREIESELSGTASRIIAAEGANVMVVHHDRTDVDLDIRDAILEITMETQDRKHAQRVIDALRVNGFKVS